MARGNEEDDETNARVLLVAYDGSAMSEAQLHLACRAAKHTQAAVRALYVVERPAQLPSDVPITAEESKRAEQLEERLERIAERYAVPCAFVVEMARSVSVAIVEEARSCDARVLFVGLRDRPRRGTTLMFSRTLRHILQHAPCPVQIGYLPSTLPEELALAD